jgi:hypothetical protein
MRWADNEGHPEKGMPDWPILVNLLFANDT